MSSVSTSNLPRLIHTMFGFSACKSCVESTFESLLILAAGNAEVRSDKNAEEVIDQLGREQRLCNIVKLHVFLPIKKGSFMETQNTHQKLIALLDQANARYRIVEHAPEGRTELVNQMRGNPLSQAVKSLVVLVKISKKESRYFLVNIPGDRRADLNAIKALRGGERVMFAPAEKARELTGCEMGAVPPFAFNAHLTLVLDTTLLECEELVFNAGRLDRSIFIHKDDYLKVASPMLVQIL